MTKIDFLSVLSPEEQHALLIALPELRYTDGDVIFDRGDKTDDVYFILQGTIKSVNYGPDGKMTYFRARHAGDFFGYYSALTGEPRTARLLSVGPAALKKMKGPDFVRLVTHNPELSRRMLKIVTDLLREETIRLSNIMTMDTRAIVCAHLLFMRDLQNCSILSIPSREEMAAHLGLTRETLSRTLNILAKEGIIRLDRDIIEIREVAPLQEIAQT